MRLKCRHCGSQDIWDYIPGGGATGKHYRCKACFGVTPEAEAFETKPEAPRSPVQKPAVNPSIADAHRQTAETAPGKCAAINPLIADAKRRAQAAATETNSRN